MQVVAIDLDLNQDVDEGEQGEHQLGAGAHGSQQDRGQSQSSDPKVTSILSAAKIEFNPAYPGL